MPCFDAATIALFLAMSVPGPPEWVMYSPTLIFHTYKVQNQWGSDTVKQSFWVIKYDDKGCAVTIRKYPSFIPDGEA